MFDPQLPLTTDAALLAMADETVGRASRRQTWLLLLDEDDRVCQEVLPVIDGIPVDADPEEIAAFAGMISTLVASVPGMRSAVVVWERTGPAEVRMQEADWIAGLAGSSAPIRLQLLSSDEGVHVVDPAFAALVAR